MARNCIIIPARYASTRFPGKLLQQIDEMTILQHVYRNALKSDLISKVIIATDDERIAVHCKESQMDCIMTRDDHESGTDRIAEALSYLDTEFDYVVNLQGDLPLVSYREINALLNLMVAKKADIGTLYSNNKAIKNNNPNVVKLVTNTDNKVLYFSRSSIPYERDEKGVTPIKHHIGMYGFRPKALAKLVKLPPSTMEIAEKLEQLRWLENGYSIYAAEVDYKGIGVDTPQDLEVVKQLINA